MLLNQLLCSKNVDSAAAHETVNQSFFFQLNATLRTTFLDVFVMVDLRPLTLVKGLNYNFGTEINQVGWISQLTILKNKRALFKQL